MFTTFPPAMKHLSQVTREKYYEHIENEIHLKRSIPRQANNCIP